MSYYLVCTCANPAVSPYAVGTAQCQRCGGWKSISSFNFKVSNTPQGTRQTQRTPGTPDRPDPPNRKDRST